MKNTNLLLGILTLLTILAGFSGSANEYIIGRSISTAALSDKAFLAELVQTDNPLSGKKLYRKNCSRCHRKNLKGFPPTYPSLLGIDEKLAKSEVRKQIHEGIGKMPSFSYLSEKEVEAIITYLFNQGKE